MDDFTKAEKVINHLSLTIIAKKTGIPYGTVNRYRQDNDLIGKAGKERVRALVDLYDNQQMIFTSLKYRDIALLIKEYLLKGLNYLNLKEIARVDPKIVINYSNPLKPTFELDYQNDSWDEYSHEVAVQCFFKKTKHAWQLIGNYDSHEITSVLNFEPQTTKYLSEPVPEKYNIQDFLDNLTKTGQKKATLMKLTVPSLIEATFKTLLSYNFFEQESEKISDEIEDEVAISFVKDQLNLVGLNQYDIHTPTIKYANIKQLDSIPKPIGEFIKILTFYSPEAKQLYKNYLKTSKTFLDVEELTDKLRDVLDSFEDSAFKVLIRKGYSYKALELIPAEESKYSRDFEVSKKKIDEIAKNFHALDSNYGWFSYQNNLFFVTFSYNENLRFHFINLTKIAKFISSDPQNAETTDKQLLELGKKYVKKHEGQNFIKQYFFDNNNNQINLPDHHEKRAMNDWSFNGLIDL